MQGYRVPMTVARERPLVYVLDDEELWRKSIQTALQNDFEVETSAPAPEALLDIGERRPDVVIFDLHMPGMDTLLLMEALHDATDTLGEVGERVGLLDELLRVVLAEVAEAEGVGVAHRRRGPRLGDGDEGDGGGVAPRGEGGPVDAVADEREVVGEGHGETSRG